MLSLLWRYVEFGFTRLFSLRYVLSGSLFLLFCSGFFSVAFASPDALTSVFGTPEEFVSNFESSVTDKANEIIGLLVAGVGFRVVLRTFIS